jgi:hypothetical protein
VRRMPTTTVEPECLDETARSWVRRRLTTFEPERRETTWRRVRSMLTTWEPECLLMTIHSPTTDSAAGVSQVERQLIGGGRIQ